MLSVDSWDDKLLKEEWQELANHEYLALNSPTTLDAVKIIIMEEVTIYEHLSFHGET